MQVGLQKPKGSHTDTRARETKPESRSGAPQLHAGQNNKKQERNKMPSIRRRCNAETEEKFDGVAKGRSNKRPILERSTERAQTQWRTLLPRAAQEPLLRCCCAPAALPQLIRWVFMKSLAVPVFSADSLRAFPASSRAFCSASFASLFFSWIFFSLRDNASQSVQKET